MPFFSLKRDNLTSLSIPDLFVDPAETTPKPYSMSGTNRVSDEQAIRGSARGPIHLPHREQDPNEFAGRGLAIEDPAQANNFRIRRGEPVLGSIIHFLRMPLPQQHMATSFEYWMIPLPSISTMVCKEASNSAQHFAMLVTGLSGWSVA